jgi:hypothetical protein
MTTFPAMGSQENIDILFELLKPCFSSFRMPKILKLLPTLSYVICTLANHHRDTSGMKCKLKHLQSFYCCFAAHSLTYRASIMDFINLIKTYQNNLVILESID